MDTLYISLLSYYLHLLYDTTANKTNINIYALTAITKSTPGGYIIGAQRLAIKEINSNNSILSNYNLSLIVLDTDEEKPKAVKLSLGLTQIEHGTESTDINIPFVLGVTYSVLSITVNPILSAFNWAQISSASTSVLLSDKESYPTFFRSIASDAIQSKGIALLCARFNWTKIGVVHTNDAFGVYLTQNLLELGNKYGFETHAIAFVDENIASILNAVETIKKFEIYIIVVIAHESELNMLFTSLNQYGLMGFPYFYIGVDSWFDKSRIHIGGLAKYSKGYIGTVPWQPIQSIHSNEIYNISNKIYHKIQQLWSNEYLNNPSFSTNFSEMNTKSIYAWDSVYALVIALNKYDTLYNISTIKHEEIEIVSKRLQNIMRSDDFFFLSVTGNVSFHKNGDRKHALYAFGNVIDDDGNVNYFGYFGDDDDIINVEFNDIIWPNDFIDNDMMPRSHKLITYELQHVDTTYKIIFVILSLLSMIFVFIIFIMTILWKNNTIFQNILWKLNLLICIGCIMIQIILILSVFELTDNICLVIQWLLSLSFTFTFIPFYLKMYKLSSIYSTILDNNQHNDSINIYYLLCFILIDVVILILNTIFNPSYQYIINGELIEINALHSIQTQHIVCNTSKLFFIIMGAYKVAILMFGIFLAFSISKLGFFTMKEIKKFDHFKETQSLLIVTFATMIIFLFVTIALLLIETNETNFYIIISSVALIITNMVLIGNVAPRFYAILSHKEYKYVSSETEDLRKILRDMIKKRHYDKKYIREIIHETEREKDVQRMKVNPNLVLESNHHIQHNQHNHENDETKNSDLPLLH